MADRGSSSPLLTKNGSADHGGRSLYPKAFTGAGYLSAGFYGNGATGSQAVAIAGNEMEQEEEEEEEEEEMNMDEEKTPVKKRNSSDPRKYTYIDFSNQIIHTDWNNHKYGVVKKKVNHKREEKMHSKVKMTS